MKNPASMKITRFVSSATLIALLAACGGGGSGSANGSVSGPATSGTGGQQSTATSLGGTVAIGTALVGATVTVVDGNGHTAIATSDSNGNYSVGIQGLTAPFVVEAADSSDASSLLYSVVANAHTTGNAPLIANVTPLTTAVAALLTQSGNPGDLIGNVSAITSGTIGTAEGILGQALSPILKANGVAANVDPIATPFTANQTGLDAVIDAVSVDPSAKGTGLQLSTLADPNTAIQLNSTTTTATALAVPAQLANYLASLQAAMSQCMTDVQGGASITSDAACTTAIATGYLNQSYATMQARHGAMFASGAKLTGIRTQAFLPSGTLPNTSGPVSLVYFLFTDATGKPNFAMDFVEQTSNGWQVIGNQEQYNLYIASFVGRLQHTDAADQANDRYESGLRILIPATLAQPDAQMGTPNTLVGSALVKGPGLPANGAWLSWVAGLASTSYLGFPAAAMTGPYVDPGCTTFGNESIACSWSTSPMTASAEYKLSWTAIAGKGSVTVPNTTDYAPSPMDLSTITQYGAYTVQIYDNKGNAVGTPQTVVNVGALQAPQAGRQFAWQTLGRDVIGNFLSAADSMSATGVDWTESPIQPIEPATIQVGEIIPHGSIPQLPQVAIAYNTFSSAADPTQNGFNYSLPSFVMPANLALSADQSRLVSLIEQVGGAYYLNTWQYGQ